MYFFNISVNIPAFITIIINQNRITDAKNRAAELIILTLQLCLQNLFLWQMIICIQLF